MLFKDWAAVLGRMVHGGRWTCGIGWLGAGAAEEKLAEFRRSGGERMPDYRRNRVAGGSFFFTVNLMDRRSRLLADQIESLREAVRRVRAERPFHIDAWVALPEHMHCIWTLPEGDEDFPGRWRAIKTLFSKRVPAVERRSETAVRRGERGVWQRRYWEHTIRDERDYAVHMDYVHLNPVKHGLVSAPGEWPYSSFRTCVARGVYPADWMGRDVALPEDGERREA